MLFKVIAFVLPLGLDTLALSIALGLRGVKPLHPAIVFAVFETATPLIGILLGALVSVWFRDLAEYVGGIVLIGLGIHAFREAAETVEEAERLSFSTIRTMVAAGLAVSIDELAIGFPLATERLSIPLVLTAIALQAFIVGYIGIVFGARLGEHASRRAGMLAGAAFVLLGLWLVTNHLIFKGA